MLTINQELDECNSCLIKLLHQWNWQRQLQF